MRKRKKQKKRAIFKLYSKTRLSKFPIVEDGDMIECYDCGRDHRLRSSVCIQTGKKDELFFVYYCDREWRIGAVRGRLVMNREPDMKK
jgi:hypothetical protein